MSLPEGNVSNSYIQLGPIVMLEVIFVHLQHKLMGLGWDKAQDVIALLPGGRVG